MSQAEPRVLHIPLTRRDVSERLLAEAQATPAAQDPARLRAVFELLQATLHFQYHTRLEAMKAAYAPFNPDLDLGKISPPGDLAAAARMLGEELAQVLETSNYHPVSAEDVARAFQEQALFPVRVEVDLGLYDTFMIYARGRTIREVVLPRWLGLGSRRLEIDTLDRVCLFVRLKSPEQLIPGQLKRLPAPAGSAILKLFRNIPVADLEMLFPGCEVRMRLMDKLLVGIPAVVGGVPVFIKLVPAAIALGVLVGLSRGPINHASLVAGLTGLVMLSAYLVQQWSKFRSRRVRLLKILSENLYFRNLDNNEGVLTRLIDEAEEEASKEVMLAYAALLRAGTPREPREVEADVLAWLAHHTGAEVAFRSDAALERLVALGLGRPVGERILAIPLCDAMVELDRRWDEFFPYHGATEDQDRLSPGGDR